jgi:hypothetical protein
MATVNVGDITVTHAILHLLDPDEGGFKPSKQALPDLTGAIRDFLAGHIAHGLSDSQIKGARFVAYSAETVPGILQQLIADRNFVADSQVLAQSAYMVMEGDKRIKPPGSLAVVRYVTTTAPGITYVAVLKLDKGGRFRWFMRGGGTKAPYWDLEETTDVAPSTEERLHKAAFVGPISDSELEHVRAFNSSSVSGRAHQFLVLDRQVKGGADWWLSKFLIAEAAFTDDERAERWFKGALAGKSRVQLRLTGDQRAALDRAIGSALEGSGVDVNDWANSLSMPEDLKAELRTEIDSKRPDNEFSISDSIRKKYAKRTWIGDNGLRVTIDALYSDQVRPELANGVWEITIRTSRWDPVA